MTDPITLLTAGFIGNVTANALYDAGKWSLEKTGEWIRHQWFEPNAFEIIQKEIKKAFQKAWNSIENRYRDGGQWKRLSEEDRELIHGRSQWLDKPDFQVRIFPQIVLTTQYTTQTGDIHALLPDRNAANEALFQHLEDLGLIEGLPSDFEQLLHEYLLDGIVYHFIEDGIKDNDELRHVLFYQQLQVLQIGQKVEQAQLEEVLTAFEQLKECTRWQTEVQQKLDQKLDEVKETIRDETLKVRQEIAIFRDLVTPRLLQEIRRLPPFLYLIDFLGREKELQELATAWSQGTRAVLVYGLPGIGKSALVSHFLEKSAGVPSEDVFRNDFRLTPDFSSFARQLGLFLEMPAPTTETPEAYIFGLLSSLHSRGCVLFFDNFEEALRPISDTKPGGLHGRALKIKDPSLEQFIDQLLRTEHAAHVIFTSRFKPDFGTANTYVQEVPNRELSGLPVADGRELVRRRKGVTPISDAEWLEIDRQLEGHPAALELFGLILKEGIYTARELLTRVEKIDKESAQSPFIERLAEEMLDTLYARLSDTEQMLLRRTSVIRLPFNATACAILASITEMEAKAIIDILFRKCLFRRQDTLFHFHPLVQSYSLTRLRNDASEQIESHLRAAEYYLMLDDASRPWQHENDTSTALEAFYHLQLFDEERAYALLGEVTAFLEERGIAYYLQGSYANCESTARTRITHLEKYKDVSAKDAQNYGRAQFHLGNILLKQHKINVETRAAFQQATTYAPDYIPAWQTWAIMESEQGNIERARALFEFAAQANDSDPITWQAWAIMERQQGNFERTRELFGKSIEVDPRHAPTWQAWAIMEADQGEVERARALFAKAVEVGPHQGPVWRAWATMERDQRNIERARELFAKAVEVDPRHTSAWQAWAIMEREQGDIKRARELFTKAVEVGPRHAPAWQAWAIMESEQGNIEYARVLFAKSIEVDPRHVYAWQAWAIMERKQRNFEQASELFAKTAELDPQNVVVWEAWAIMESEQGNAERARQLFEKAVELDPYNALVWQTWAIMESEQRNLKRARELFEYAVQADDSDPITWQAWGVLESKARHYDRALELLERSYEIERKDPLTLHSIAIVYLRLRRLDNARTFLEKALELDPENYIIWFSLGEVELQTKQYARAEAHVLRALELKPSDARAWSMLGDLQAKTNRDDEAEASYNKSLALDGSHRAKSRTYCKKAELLKRRAGRESDAELAYRLAIEVDPNNPYYHHSLGEFLYWHQRYTEAESEYKRTLELAPNDSYTMVNLAGLLARLPGRSEEAESLFLQALHGSENDWRVHAHYANFLTWRGRFDEAEAHFLRSLEISENPRVREQYNQMLRKSSDGKNA